MPKDHQENAYALRHVDVSQPAFGIKITCHEFTFGRYAATFGINAALCGVAGSLISITFTLHPYVGLPYTVRSFMIVIVAGLGNLPGVALSGMGLGVFEEFADYILGTEFRIGAVFMLLVFILVYRRFVLSRKREYLK